MELFEAMWPALLLIAGALIAYGWSKLKQAAAKTPTKIDDDLIRIIQEVIADRELMKGLDKEKSDPKIVNITGLRTMEARGVDNE